MDWLIQDFGIFLFIYNFGIMIIFTASFSMIAWDILMSAFNMEYVHVYVIKIIYMVTDFHVVTFCEHFCYT